jgi:hypothetical protein
LSSLAWSVQFRARTKGKTESGVGYVKRNAIAGHSFAFGSLGELTRVVGNDCAVEIDTNSYSVPWRLIGERVAVTVAAGEVRIRHGVRQPALRNRRHADHLQPQRCRMGHGVRRSGGRDRDPRDHEPEGMSIPTGGGRRGSEGGGWSKMSNEPLARERTIHRPPSDTVR